MQSRTHRMRRLTWALAAVAALVATDVATATAGSIERPAAPAQAAPTQAPSVEDPQTGPPWEGDSFEGYQGLVDDGVGGGTELPGDDDEESKPDRPDDNRDDLGVEPPPNDVRSDGRTDAVTPGGRLGHSDDELQAAVEEDGGVRVIVRTRTPVEPEAELRTAEVDAQRARIDDALDALAASLEGTDSQVLTEFEIVPAAVLEVDEAGLDALLANPDVESITIDREMEFTLDVSTTVIGSDRLNDAGVRGDNFQGGLGGPFEIAIIDTGVYNAHAAFTDRIVSQACYSDNNGCPNGSNQQIGGNAGNRCTLSVQCDHGTHVAGIAAGAAFPDGGHEGVAGGAGIVAIQVAHVTNTCGANEANPCLRAHTSNIDLALQRVLTLRNSQGRNIRAVNLSIGSNELISTWAACDAAYPNTHNLTTQLHSANVLVVAASGNHGSTTAISHPSCHSSTFSVGATNDFDSPWSSSNSTGIMDMWAPGVAINAPITLTTIARGHKTGTSQASPHVAGAAALLAECIDPSTQLPQNANQVMEDLLLTGPFVSRGVLTKRRVNVHQAAVRNVPNNNFNQARVLTGNGPINNKAWNVCADAQPGEPGVGTPNSTIWWRWTAPSTGTVTISTDNGGGNATTFDTQLSVFTGNSLGSLDLVAYDDDGGIGTRSKVVIPVNAGTTFRIRVDGYQDENGYVNLHITNGPPPTCRGVAATIVGTPGDDLINGTSGNDVIVAGDGNDVVYGNDGNDRICLGAGDDEAYGGDGNDVIDGESGDDEIYGEGGHDLIYGGPGADKLFGGGGNDVILGNAGGADPDDGDDELRGGPGDDLLDGWIGEDQLWGGPGNDTIIGGDGYDIANFGGSSNGVNANLTTGIATGEGNDTLEGIEGLKGSPHDDVLIGDGGQNHLTGLGGNDLLNGRGGEDILSGGAGNDTLIGGPGNDLLYGGPGNDTASYAPSATAVNVNLATGEARGEGIDSLSGIENVIGSAHNDTLVGNAGVNVIRGRGGADTINGLGGNDRLYGEAGNDTINGGDGADQIFGGPGADTLRGNAGNDVIRGEDGADVIEGGDGADQLFGGNANDILRGGAGNDTMNGGAGVDQCHGGVGTDTATACEMVTGVP